MNGCNERAKCKFARPEGKCWKFRCRSCHHWFAMCKMSKHASVCQQCPEPANAKTKTW